MTNSRSLSYILILFAVILGGYFIFSNRILAPGRGEVVAAETAQAAVPLTHGELVDVDGSTYRFDSVRFTFTDGGVNRSGIPLTTVRFQFRNFVRNGISIDVLPYRLGTHQGVCVEVPGIITSLTPDQQVLGYARCWWNGVGKEFVVFQDGLNVVAQYRSVSETQKELEPLKPLLTIAVPSIVQE